MVKYKNYKNKYEFKVQQTTIKLKIHRVNNYLLVR